MHVDRRTDPHKQFNRRREARKIYRVLSDRNAARERSIRVSLEIRLCSAVPEAASFDERWAAWQAKGAARDRAVRRKLAVALPLLIVVAAVVAYVLLGR